MIRLIVIGKLDYHKSCARWISIIVNKKERIAAVLTFLEDYDKRENQVIDRIVTDDEI